MKEKMICRGDLFYYDFGDNSGSVQSGERPVLVVQADDYNQNAPTIIVAAVTSVIKKRYLPWIKHGIAEIMHRLRIEPTE